MIWLLTAFPSASVYFFLRTQWTPYYLSNLPIIDPFQDLSSWCFFLLEYSSPRNLKAGSQILFKFMFKCHLHATLSETACPMALSSYTTLFFFISHYLYFIMHLFFFTHYLSCALEYNSIRLDFCLSHLFL